MTYNIAAAKALNETICRSNRNKFLEQKREEYAEYKAESRACGYEVESFSEFIGESNLKDERSDFYSSLTSEQLDLY